VLGALASLVSYAQDRRFRRSAERLARLALRDRDLAAELRAVDLEPSGDLAAAMVAGAVVVERPEPDRGIAAPSVGNRIASLPGEVLAATEALILDALSSRPGWAGHRYLLGLLDFERARQMGDRRLEPWSEVMRLAAIAEPGSDAAWIALGRADLDSWEGLQGPDRAGTIAILRRCLLNEGFVSSRYGQVIATLGKTRAIGLLPEDPHVLQAAASVLIETGEVDGTSEVLARAERAERSERAADLQRIESSSFLRSRTSLRMKCQLWFDRHAYRDFDDTGAREELARLLARWPDDVYGAWKNDSRAMLVRFLLDGREASVSGQTLLKTLNSLTGVPDAVRARAMVLAGNIAGAQRLERGGVLDPLDWTPYFLELSRRQFAAGRASEASRTLDRLWPGEREDCDALLIRRQLGRKLEDHAEVAAVQNGLDLLRSEPSDEQGAPRTAAFCLDPERDAGGWLQVDVGEGRPALVSYGWDSGRLGTRAVPPGNFTFRIPLSGLSGRHRFWISVVAGEKTRSLRDSIRGAA